MILFINLKKYKLIIMSMNSDEYLILYHSLNDGINRKNDCNDQEINEMKKCESVSYSNSGNYTTFDNTTFTLQSAGKTVGKCKYINNGNQNYSIQQHAKTKKEITDTITRSSVSIPPVVIKATIDLYHKGVQKNKITRADVKRGCQAACLYIMCNAYGIPYKPKEIAKIFDISPPSLSTGINKVYSLRNNIR